MVVHDRQIAATVAVEVTGDGAERVPIPGTGGHGVADGVRAEPAAGVGQRGGHADRTVGVVVKNPPVIAAITVEVTTGLTHQRILHRGGGAAQMDVQVVLVDIDRHAAV